jgi:hypothetical protein
MRVAATKTRSNNPLSPPTFILSHSPGISCSTNLITKQHPSSHFRQRRASPSTFSVKTVVRHRRPHRSSFHRHYRRARCCELRRHRDIALNHMTELRTFLSFTSISTHS